MSLLFRTVACAGLALASVAHAQRVDVDPARATSFDKPITIRPGELISSDLAETDYRVGPRWHSEQFTFTGRAGDVVTAQVRTGLPDLEVVFREQGYSGQVLARGSGKSAPVRATLPKDGTYFLIVGAKGPQHVGKYLLSFGSGDNAPPFDPPKPQPPPSPPAQVAQAPALKAAPLVAPALPAIPGVAAIRTGQTLTRPAGKPGPGLETFQLIGARGDKLHVRATGGGGLAVSLYTPESALMLSVDDPVAAPLDAYLPVDGVYFLSVARGDAARPYKLAMAIEEAHPLDAHFANGVGYQTRDAKGVTKTTCWVRPGQQLRMITSDGVDIVGTYTERGKVSWEGAFLTTKVKFNASFTLDGDEIVANHNGAISRGPIEQPKMAGVWSSYLCR